MVMILNDDSIDFLPEIPMFEEQTAIPLKCWENNVCLSKIWIPSNLLASRKKPSNSWVFIYLHVSFLFFLHTLFIYFLNYLFL